MLLCSRINLETMKGSVTQLGASLRFPGASHPGVQQRWVQPCVRVWFQNTSSSERWVQICIHQHPALSWRGYSMSHQSVLIQGSIPQRPQLHLSSNTLDFCEISLIWFGLSFMNTDCGSRFIGAKKCFTLDQFTLRHPLRSCYLDNIAPRVTGARCTLFATIKIQPLSPFGIKAALINILV